MIEIVSPQSPEDFLHYYRVRWETLRAPWNQPPGSEKDDKENESIHLMATEHHEVFGVCRLQYNSAQEAQVRFMGVTENARGKGVGKKLMQEAERIAKSNGCDRLILQAREIAVPFYRSCGYEVVEKSFLMWGEIQHFLMAKSI